MLITELTKDHVNTQVQVYGRVHHTRRPSPNTRFVILRHNTTTLQCMIYAKNNNIPLVDALLLNRALDIKLESLVSIDGILKLSPTPIKSCSITDMELHITNISIITEPIEQIPFNIELANQPYFLINDKTNINLQTRLDNRYFELRTNLNYLIFNLQSQLVKNMRNFVEDNNFIEIHTPKIISGSSEGGSDTFEISYFNKKASLSQSPQLYKQMMINADFHKVYEVGSVFRAENSNTHRHLTEFVGFDIEMEINDYNDLINFIYKLLVYTINNLQKSQHYKLLKTIYNFNDIVISNELIVITYEEALKLVKRNNINIEVEKELGLIMKQKYNTDLFVIIDYPINERPFYTKRQDNKKYTNSFDFILGGNEICSGSERENNYDKLCENIKDKKIDIIDYYINSFKFGSPKHGGCGFGIERLLMLILNLNDIRLTSLFPRDPTRLKP